MSGRSLEGRMTWTHASDGEVPGSLDDLETGDGARSQEACAVA
jgi:hypothetical protein